MFKNDLKNYLLATIFTCALFFLIYVYLCKNNLAVDKEKKDVQPPENKGGQVTITIPQENTKQVAMKEPEKKEPEKKEPEKKEPEKKEPEKKELAKGKLEKKGGAEKKEDVRKEDLVKNEIKKDVQLSKANKESDEKRNIAANGSVDLTSSVSGEGKGAVSKELAKKEKDKEENKNSLMAKKSLEKNTKGEGAIQSQNLNLPVPSNDTNPSVVSPVQGKYEGVMPPIFYTGETDRFFKKYPRLECVWVYDNPIDKPGTTPSVVFEFIVDSVGRLAYQNIRNSSTFGDFTDTIYDYDSNSQVKISSPSGFKILNFLSKISEISGIQNNLESQISIGLYRRKEEVAFLAPVARAFKQMVVDKKINYDLKENSRIEVNWGLNSDGMIFVNYANFVPAKGVPVKLEF